MQRSFIAFLAATLAFAAATAEAQGDLAGVTMRVLDDIGAIDAVILVLDRERAEDEEGAERDGRGTSDEEQPAADAAEDSRPAASQPTP